MAEIFSRNISHSPSAQPQTSFWKNLISRFVKSPSLRGVLSPMFPKINACYAPQRLFSDRISNHQVKNGIKKERVSHILPGNS